MIGENIVTIHKIQDYELIKNWINEQITDFNNKKIKFVLIYKATRNGFTTNDFHESCEVKQ